ncbi:2-(1,2-epoxy-1,2-dihydrophenyl)acetyl-CoA isomerase [Tepidimonas fonticaldi]|uniref:2-(1,2-epoxy-1,2-dihydrophenyl)acetyl-CoA isomerase n=1 Tax=Tepidimonas fonticaldi TaxID=1101373 RepID=A0A1A6DU67_9BURK|nr:enoyl-CoA hydratase-related protein [Tepidimonas fonticaldi]OBS30221.1 2-(1,2-epoxy-1,2-dihydrophenyl)acetyl-CoA isomerase [Tepidimonas fonticaldi]
MTPTPAAAPAADEIVFERRGAVAVLTLNRPQALNSFTRTMHRAFQQALAAVQGDTGIRALVLTGAGRGFCAGLDLSELDFSPGPDRMERANPGPVIEEGFNPSARALMNLRVPTVAAVNGVAAGAGVSLALTCDIAIAAPGASFVQAFSKIGLIPDAGGSWLTVERLGLARALALALLGDKLPADQAKAWGLIWDVADDPLAAALALAERLAAMPTQALVATRHLLRGALQRSFEQQLDAERDLQAALGRTHDYVEGVTAFLQKRPAQFRGE